MTAKVRRGACVIFLGGLIAGTVYTTGGPPFDDTQARQALLQFYGSSLGPSPTPLYELQRDPLVVHTSPDGRENWVIGHWTIDPVSRRYEHDNPDFHGGMVKVDGWFRLSWRKWEAKSDEFVFIGWPSYNPTKMR
jgi:hypothetical protein